MNINKLQQFLCVYLTQFPNILYNHGLNNGNMAIAGIGLGLIRCQIFFWINKIILIISLFTFNYDLNYIFFYILLCIFNIKILYFVFLETNYLIKLLNYKENTNE